MFQRNKLKGKMAENGVGVERLSAILGINQTTLYRKIVGSSDFTRAEIQKISEVLHLSSEERDNIFFAP